MIVCSVKKMEHSSGLPDYYVSICKDGKEMTPHRYKQRGRAEYDVARWEWLLNGGPEPDILAYDADTVG